ncbi:MAG: DUF4340 domain-containing protein [Candidatus Limiplasma sp.]|nr:DUF4340 domain-containing protein [Candidatus Limiplasma sp.]
MKAKQHAVVGLLICIALLGTLLGTLLGWLSFTPAQKAVLEQTATVYEVVNLPLADMTAVKVENTEASFAVLNGAQGVEMLSQAHNKYDESQLRAFLYAAGHITGSLKVTDRGTFDDYGLAQPRASVTLYRSDNTQLRYSVLMDNPMDQSTYLYVEADEAIYLVPREIALLFLRTERDFISHQVLPLRSQDEVDMIRQIDVFYHGTGRNYSVEQTEQGFYLKAPVSMRLSRLNVISALINPLIQLYADEVVATDADLSVYGLDQPELEIALTLGSETVHALLRRIEGNQCLMAEKGGTVIYRLDDAPLLMLLQDYTTLLGGGIVSYETGGITDVTFSVEGKSLTVLFSVESAAMTTPSGTVELSRDLQTLLRHALNQLTPVAEINRPTEAKPSIQWTATLSTGAQETVALWPLTTEVYAVSVNGTVAFATDAAAVERLMTLWDNLTDIGQRR